jgi:hypothetical protein
MLAQRPCADLPREVTGTGPLVTHPCSQVSDEEDYLIPSGLRRRPCER